MRNRSYENEYDLHSNGLVSKTHFHMKGFALGLVLKQRQKRTRKWPIGLPQGDASRGEAFPRDASPRWSPFRARACISLESPKLDGTRSLVFICTVRLKLLFLLFQV